MFFFFFNDTATTEIYTLSLHDALPISIERLNPDVNAFVELAAERARAEAEAIGPGDERPLAGVPIAIKDIGPVTERSEEHTSELQSRQYLVCRLLLEKKKNLETISTDI